jgi:hypothetical protein
MSGARRRSGRRGTARLRGLEIAMEAAALHVTLAEKG